MRRIFESKRTAFYRRPSGFTMVELIVVITIVAILAAVSTSFIRNPLNAYIDTENYTNLSDRADTALRRMTRDVRNALPNSVRVTTTGLDSFVEFIPVKAAGRYRAAVGNSVTDDPLDFASSADTFDVLGAPVQVAAGDRLVIYNLGITGADAYEGSNIYPLQTAGTLNKLSYAGGQFPLPSPSSRFYTVSGAASYACDMTNKQLLMYSDYAIANVQPSSVATLNSLASPRVLANNLSTCEISYTPGVLQRSGIVMVTLGFIQDTAKLSLMHLITIANSP